MANRTSAFVDALKIPLALVVLLGATFGAYYFIYVRGEHEYLIGRNFRLLAMMGEQIDQAIHNHNTVLSSHLPKTGVNNANEVRVKLEQAMDFVPILRHAKIDWSKKEAITLESTRFELAEHDDSRFTWLRRGDEPPNAPKNRVVFRLDLDDVLTPLVQAEPQRTIFDAIFVAARDGRVIFHSGDPRLRIARVDKLTTDTKPAAEVNFQQIARSAAMLDVRVAGSAYKLMIQPCCGGMYREAQAADAGDGWVLGGLTAQGKLAAASSAFSFSMTMLAIAVLLLAAFSWPFLKLRFIGEAQRVKAADVAMVGLGGLLAIASIAAWALDLYGYWRLQAVLDDQLALFASSVKTQAAEEVTAALAELTRLEARYIGDSNVPDLKPDIADAAGIARGDFSAYPFFESLAFVDASGTQRRKLAVESFVTPLIDVSAREYFTYWRSSPRTEGAGQPVQPKAFLQPVQSVTTGSREAVLSKRSLDPDKFPVTTMTIPMHSLIDPTMAPGFGFAVISGDGRVLFHSDPDHKLSENFFVEADGSRRLKALVSARRQEWLDITYWGDAHRAYVTPMDLSIDDRQGARSDKGSDTSERRKPSEFALFGSPWTLVTFYDQDVAHTVNVEWLVIVAALLVMYTGVYVVICVGLLYLRPKYRAPWLWPDPTQSRTYLNAIPPLLVLSATFVTAIVVLRPADLIGVGALLPFVAWILAYGLLARCADHALVKWATSVAALSLLLLLVVMLQQHIVGWRSVAAIVFGSVAAWAVAAVSQSTSDRRSPLAPPVNVSYGFVAGLVALLVTALPAAAFFKASYDTVIESFVKYGQLEYAQDLFDHERRAEDALAKRIVDPTARERVRRLRAEQSKWWGGYDTFFFCSQPAKIKVAADLVPECQPLATDEAVAPEHSDEVLAETVEELLPFYSDSSTRFRELAHDEAGDQSWRSTRSGRKLFLDVTTPHKAASFVALKPPFLEWPLSGKSNAFGIVLLGLLGVGVLGAAIWVVRFVMREVFVVDVIEPLWSGSTDPLGDVWGPHLFIVSAEQHLDERHLSTYCKVDLAEAPLGDAQQCQWLDEQLEKLTQSGAAHDVLIVRFERRAHDRGFSERKVRLIERAIKDLNRTVIILSGVPPGVFFANAGSTDADAELKRRWSDLLSHFTVVPASPSGRLAPVAVPDASDAAVLANWGSGGWREIVWRLNALGFAHRARFVEEERRDPTVGRFWRAVLPYAWHPDRPALDVGQLLVEVGERAESHYREIWATCTPAEKLVLGQIAEEGLVNEKTKRTVRFLMSRGLVQRQPHFVLMSETFRQFVLSSSVHDEVAEMEEQSTGTWDVIRWPFLIALVGGAAFFVATQEELGKTVLGVLTAAATLVPTVIKIASVGGDRRPST